MEGKQLLFYALGNVAYAVAMADGTLQAAEKQKLHDLVLREMSILGPDIDVSEIIFHVLGKHHNDAESAYAWGMNEFERSSQWLTDDLKVDFYAIVEKIARAFGPVTEEENAWIARFRHDLDALPTT